MKSLKERHKELAKHLGNHNSPIRELPALEYLLENITRAEVDREKFLRDLIDRSEACKPEGYCRRKIRANEDLNSF